MSSMGYIMMNWSLELARQAKCFRKCKNLEVMKRGRETHESKKEAEDNVGAEERRKSAEQEGDSTSFSFLLNLLTEPRI